MSAGTFFNPATAIWCFVLEFGVSFDLETFWGLGVTCDLDRPSFFRKASFFLLIFKFSCLRAVILYLYLEICQLNLFWNLIFDSYLKSSLQRSFSHLYLLFLLFSVESFEILSLSGVGFLHSFLLCFKIIILT